MVRIQNTGKPLIIFLILIMLPVPVFSEFEWSFDAVFDGGFDDNANLAPSSRDSTTDSMFAVLNPELDLSWISGRNDFKMRLEYLGEYYLDSDDLDDEHAVYSESSYAFRMTDSVYFVYDDHFDYAGFGADYMDRPEFRGDYMAYDAATGFRYVYNDVFDFEIDAVFGTMEYDDPEDDAQRIIEPVDWNDIGFRVSASYRVIPEMGFLISYENKTRDLDAYDPVPETDIISGSFGFTSVLPSRTEVTLKGSLYRFVFSGIPPRHTESDYNNYGVNLTVKHPLAGTGELTISGYSRFELSDRNPRLFYRDTGVEIRYLWETDSPFSLDLSGQYDELDYQGLENAFRETLFSASTTVEYRVAAWLKLGGTYRFFQRESPAPEDDIQSNRIAFRLRFLFPDV